MTARMATWAIGISGFLGAVTAHAKQMPYKIPKGQYLQEDLILEASNVRLKTKRDGSVKSVRYCLPPEIDGAEGREVLLEHKPELPAGEVTGPLGHGKCSRRDGIMSCDIKYFKTEIDPSTRKPFFPLKLTEAQDYIDTLQASPDQLDLFKRAQMSLMHEAAGVLMIEDHN